jgi:hypothetical protein
MLAQPRVEVDLAVERGVDVLAERQRGLDAVQEGREGVARCAGGQRRAGRERVVVDEDDGPARGPPAVAGDGRAAGFLTFLELLATRLGNRAGFCVRMGG